MAKDYRLPKLTVFAGLSVLAALATYWTVFGSDNAASRLLSRIEPSDRIDLYVEQPRGVKFDDQGRRVQTFEAAHLSHFLTSNHSDMTLPRFHIYTERGEIWDGTAATATLLGDSEIRLRDNVVIVDQPGTTRLTTEQLNYFPKQQKVDSAVAVLVKRATDTSKSVGIHADLNTNRVELLSRVEGIHVP